MSTSSENRAMALNTFDRDVPPLNAMGRRPGITKRYCNTQQTQTSFSSTDGARERAGPSARRIFDCSSRGSCRKILDMRCLLMPEQSVAHPCRHGTRSALQYLEQGTRPGMVSLSADAAPFLNAK